jgi:hypothetical protein
LLILVTLVVGGLSSLCGHSTQQPVAKPPPVAVPTSAQQLPAVCPAQPPIGASAGASEPVNVTLPDLAGTNGAAAEQCLRNLGLRNIELTSANPKYHMVLD